MSGEPETNINTDIQNVDINKKKTLKEHIKDIRKNMNKPLTIQISNINNNNKEIPKKTINNNIYSDEPIYLNQKKDETKKSKIEIKKIKLISNENKINSEENPSKSNLRKIYVDLNLKELNNINEKSNSNIISEQKLRYGDNGIRTCQYTILTFLPLALINQFKSGFNWFFLIYNIIVCIPQLSDLDPLAEVAPFIVVLILNLIKEAIEDFRKYNNDKKANNSSVLIFKDNRFKRELCKNIRVGNIIKIYKEDLIPADVLIIKSSLKNGLAYMQTSNLDGENTLKPREALNLTQKKLIINLEI